MNALKDVLLQTILLYLKINSMGSQDDCKLFFVCVEKRDAQFFALFFPLSYFFFKKPSKPKLFKGPGVWEEDQTGLFLIHPS